MIYIEEQCVRCQKSVTVRESNPASYKGRICHECKTVFLRPVRYDNNWGATRPRP